MMVFTHILVGILVGAVFLVIRPEFYPFAIYAGFFGGGFPDLDMLFTHRQTLHYPIGFSLVALLVGGFVFIYPDPVLIFLFVFTLAAAIHCLMDILGGGKELRPWREIDDRAVYNHINKEWVEPRRLIYDGSVKDLFISFIAAGIIYHLHPQFGVQIGVLLLFAICYTGLRRWIAGQISEEFTTFSSYIQHLLSLVWDRLI